MKVLLVDGPKAGEVVEVGNARDALVYPVFRNGIVERFSFGTSILDETFEQVVYNFHRVVIFNHELTIGTVNHGDPYDWDAFRLLTSDLAKAAVNA